jgi:hypothetical protein
MKSREHVVTNGRAAFYAAMWQDLRSAALDCGWALALHGSLNRDMDIMAMPWTEAAKSADDMIAALKNCFSDDPNKGEKVQPKQGPNGRLIYSISIWADFYLDVSVMSREDQTK